MAYSPENVARLEGERDKLQQEAERRKLALHELAGQLKNERANTFVMHGIARRLRVIARCVNCVFEIYPPGREEHLSPDELDDIAINVHAFVINAYGILDNIAWACVLEGGGNLAPKKVGLYSPQVEVFLPPKLHGYITEDSTKKWFDKYAKLYRDSTAHRIAPYLPPRVFTPRETEEYRRLNALSLELLLGARTNVRSEFRKRLADHQDAQRQLAAIGSNSLYLCISLEGEDAVPVVQMHPQLLSDWMSIHELIDFFITGMCEAHRLAPPKLPQLI